MARIRPLITCLLVIMFWYSPTPSFGNENFGGDWLTRSKMGGDWGGTRTKLADNGVKIDVDLMQVVQVVNAVREQLGTRMAQGVSH